MQKRNEILSELVSRVEPDRANGLINDHVDQLPEDRNLDEVNWGTVGKVAAAYGAYKVLSKRFKLPKPGQFSKRQSAIEFAKALTVARDPKETVVAIVGLLNISARIMLSIPELRDLGFRITKIVQSERLEDYLTD